MPAAGAVKQPFYEWGWEGGSKRQKGISTAGRRGRGEAGQVVCCVWVGETRLRGACGGAGYVCVRKWLEAEEEPGVGPHTYTLPFSQALCVCVLFMPLLRRCAIWNKGPIWAVLTLKAAHLAATAESGTLRHFTSFTEQSLPAFFLACTLIREVWILCRYIFFYAVAAWNPSCCCFKVYPLEPKHTHYFFSHLSLLEFAVFLFWAAVEYAAIYIFICTALKLRFHWGSTVQFSVSAHKLLENCIQTCNLSFFFLEYLSLVLFCGGILYAGDMPGYSISIPHTCPCLWLPPPRSWPQVPVGNWGRAVQFDAQRISRGV